MHLPPFLIIPMMRTATSMGAGAIYSWALRLISKSKLNYSKGSIMTEKFSPSRIREFVDVVAKGNEDSFDQDATIDKALQALNLTDLKDKIPGMEITLMPHQVMGVAWMLEKEKSHIK